MRAARLFGINLLGASQWIKNSSSLAQSGAYTIDIGAALVSQGFFTNCRMYSSKFTRSIACSYSPKRRETRRRSHIHSPRIPGAAAIVQWNFLQGLAFSGSHTASAKGEIDPVRLAGLDCTRPISPIRYCDWSGIDAFIKSAGGLNNLYTEIHRGLKERKLMQIDLKQKRA